MATVEQRWQRLWAGLGRLGRWLVCAGRWLAGWLGCLVALAVLAALCVLEISKRLTVLSLLLGLACLAYAHAAAGMPGWAGPIVVAWVLGVLLMVGAQPWWVDYREKLAFLAESQPRSRALHVDGAWYERRRGLGQDRRAAWPLATAVIVALILTAGWSTAGAGIRSGLSGVVCAIAGVGFVYLTGLVRRLERRHQVGYYLRGWRLVTPERGQVWAERWRGWRRAVAVERWLSLNGGPLLRPVVEPFVRAWGTCAG